MITNINIYGCFAFLFLGEVALNLNWSIIADMLLYIVTPTCRGTAEAIQILASHAFGDAGSPYLIGLVSDGLYQYLRNAGDGCALDEDNKDIIEGDCTKDVEFRFHSLQYSLFTNFGVEIIGGILFFITAIYIVRDKLACENASAEAQRNSEGSGQKLMMTPTNYSPEDSLAEDLASDDEELPRLKRHLLITAEDETSSSRSPSP